jgi:hypothetical protein
MEIRKKNQNHVAIIMLFEVKLKKSFLGNAGNNEVNYWKTDHNHSELLASKK